MRVLQKMKTLRACSSVSSAAISASLCFLSSAKMSCWVICWCCCRCESTSINSGSLNVAFIRPSSLCFKVAENNRFCRCLLQLSAMVYISMAKPMSSMRSASSKTNTSKSRKSGVPLSICSTNRPGVAINTSGFLRKVATWCLKASPPIIRPDFM